MSRSGGTCLQDPEGILAAPKGGHITRRTFQKQLAEDKTLLEQVEKEREAAREELQARRDVSACPHYRASACALPQHMPKSGTVMCHPNSNADTPRPVQARNQPKSHAELVEYLLCTEQPEMEYETARCRPLMTQDFFGFLREEIGAHLLSEHCIQLFATQQRRSPAVSCYALPIFPDMSEERAEPTIVDSPHMPAACKASTMNGSQALKCIETSNKGGEKIG